MIFLCKIKSITDDNESCQFKFIKVANSFDSCIKSILDEYNRPNMTEHLSEIKVKVLHIDDNEILISDDIYNDLNDAY